MNLCELFKRAIIKTDNDAKRNNEEWYVVSHNNWSGVLLYDLSWKLLLLVDFR